MNRLAHLAIGFLSGCVFVWTLTEMALDSSTGDILTLLYEQCDKEKITTLRNYECSATITPVVLFIDGSMEYIKWSEK